MTRPTSVCPEEGLVCLVQRWSPGNVNDEEHGPCEKGVKEDVGKYLSGRVWEDDWKGS